MFLRFLMVRSADDRGLLYRVNNGNVMSDRHLIGTAHFGIATVKKFSSHHGATSIYALAQERVWRFLRSKECGGEAVEDVVEETFSRLTAANKLDVMQDPEHYLFTMACGALRAKEVERSRSELDGDIDGTRLFAALRALPEPLLTPLLLSVRGMTHSEIASRLGLSVSATRDRLVRARARLGLCIEWAEA